MPGQHTHVSSYDRIARLYDPWSRSVVEDVAFYVDEARRSGGPVVELGVGTGRIAVPTACAGIEVIGVDSSQRMLKVCAEQARLAGVAALLVAMALAAALAPAARATRADPLAVLKAE
jgi:methylase of polypeptide subunit release factors